MIFWTVTDKNPSYGTIIMNYNEKQREFIGIYFKNILKHINAVSVSKEIVKTNIKWN
ncbi:hypothetical protein FACS1894181_14310 [Bacteroidia bacterium]|nr:hypothetical protein FACS1894181_14310 [Bacteroidia bacterium]